MHDPPFLHAGDQTGGLQYAQVLHEPRQRHAVRPGQHAHRLAAVAERFEHLAAGGIGQRREHAVQSLIGQVNHLVEYNGVDDPLSKEVETTRPPSLSKYASSSGFQVTILRASAPVDRSIASLLGQ